MAQCQVEPLNHTGADRHAALREACATAPHALRQRLETAMALLLDDLGVDHVRMRCDTGLRGRPRVPVREIGRAHV